MVVLRGMAYSSKKILVVDDDWRLLQLIGAWLDGTSYKYELAANPFEAISLINVQAFDCFILDYRMPGMTGFELLRHIRSLSEHFHTPVLFITAEQQDDLAVSLLNAGADDYIAKPLSESLFLSKLQTNLKKSLLKKDIYLKNATDNINNERGMVLYCQSETEEYGLDWLQCKHEKIQAFNQFSAYTLNSVVWLVVIDGNALWAMQMLEKIKSLTSVEIPVLLIACDSGQAQQYAHLVSHYCLREFGNEYINHQINFIIDREKTIKEKYISSLQLASGSILSGVNRYMEKRHANMYLSALHEPFSSIPGGDFYEIIPFDSQHQLLFVGDVMGKSWNAWFFVPAYIAYIKSTIRVMAFRNILSLIEKPGSILEMLNYYISKDLQTSNVFTTLTLVVMNTVTGVLHIASAGGINPLLYRISDNAISKLSIPGLLLGIADDTRYQTIECDLQVGDVLLLFTDGYLDGIDEITKERIGMSGIETTMKRCADLNQFSAIQFENELLNNYSISQFEDDRTVAIIKRIG